MYCFSGGGASAMAHLGVIKRLKRTEYRLIILGTSAGALISSLCMWVFT